MHVRQGVDAEAAKQYGGWSKNSRIFEEFYTHPEDASSKILAANRTGLVQSDAPDAHKLLNAGR